MALFEGGAARPVYIQNQPPFMGGAAQPVVIVDGNGNPLSYVNVSAFGQSLLDDANAADARNTLGAAMAVARGRPSVSGLTGLSLPGCALTSVATQALTANQVRYAPILVDTTITIDQLVIEVTTLAGGTTARLGLYNADTNWQPTTLVVDGGLVATDANAVVAASVSATLTPGRYLTAINSNGTATLRRILGGANLWGIMPTVSANPFLSSIIVNQAYGAFPSPGTQYASGNVAGSSAPPNHLVLLRVSSP